MAHGRILRMISDLGHALLGVLARRECTGYELARLMRRPVGYFWTANHSQIYPELARLESAGYLCHEVIEGAGPRPTKRYRITAAGRAALADFVCADLEPGPTRDREVLKLWSVWVVDRQAATDLVLASRALHQARLEAYAVELAQVEADPDSRRPDRPVFASRLTLAGGVRSRRAAVEWCDWMLAELASAQWPQAARR